MNSIMGMNMKQMNSLQSSMQAMLSAGSALNRAQIQDSVINKMNGRANVLESEIKSGNGNLEAKEEELAKVRQSALDVAASQADTLGEAREAMKAAADTDKYEAGDASLLAKAKEESVEEEAVSGEESREGRTGTVLSAAGDRPYTSDGKALPQNAESIISVVA